MSADTIAKLLIKIAADNGGALSALSQTERATRAFAQSAGSSVDALSSKMDLLGTAIRAGAVAAVVGLGKVSVDAYLRLDGLQRGLTAVMGSSQAASQEMLRLQEVAKLPGLGLEQAYEGSLRLQAAGMSADVARAALLGFGNALATVGGGKAELDGVTLALTQISAKGKVMAQEINQLSERVPQIRTIMKSAFGTADTEALQKMGVTSSDFIAAVVTELSKLPRVTGGLKNDLENASDAIFQAKAAIGEGLAPGLGSIAKTATTITNEFNSWSPAVKSGIVQVMAYGSALAGVAAIAAKIKTDLATRGAVDVSANIAKSNQLMMLMQQGLFAGTYVDKIQDEIDKISPRAVGAAEQLDELAKDQRYYQRLVGESDIAIRKLRQTQVAANATNLAGTGILGRMTGSLKNTTAAIKSAAAATYAWMLANPLITTAAIAVAALGSEFVYFDNQIRKINQSTVESAKNFSNVAIKANEATKAMKDYAAAAGMGDEAAQNDNDTSRIKLLQRMMNKNSRENLGGSDSRWKNAWAYITGRSHADSPEWAQQKAMEKELLDLTVKVHGNSKKIGEAAQAYFKELNDPIKHWNGALEKAKQAGDDVGQKIAESYLAYYEAIKRNALLAAKPGSTYNKAAADLTARNKLAFGLQRSDWIKEQVQANTRNAIHSADLAVAAAKAARAGNDLGAAIAEATSARDAAIAAAMERDLKTGSYKNKNKYVRNALVAAAKAQFDLSSAEAVKTEQKRQLAVFIEAATLKYEDVAAAARGRFDSYGEAVAQANSTYAGELGRALSDRIDAKNPNWKAAIASAGKKRDQALREALLDEAQRKSGERLDESTALRSAASLAAKTKAAELQDLLDGANAPTARLKLLSDISEANTEAARNSTLSNYLSRMNELNTVKLRGVDITERARLAELELKTALVETARENKKAIDSEVEAIRQRKMAMIGFTSLEGMWARSMTAGVQEMFSGFPGAAKERDFSGLIGNKVPTVGTGPSISQELTTMKEQNRLLQSAVDELMKLNKTLPSALVAS